MRPPRAKPAHTPAPPPDPFLTWMQRIAASVHHESAPISGARGTDMISHVDVTDTSTVALIIVDTQTQSLSDSGGASARKGLSIAGIRHVRTALREPSKPGLGGPITTLHDCIGFPANGQRPEDVLWTCVSGLRSSQSLLSTKSGSGSEWAATHGERQAPAPRSLAVRDRPLRTSRSRLEASPSTKPRPRLFVRGHRIRPRTMQCARAPTVTPQTRSRTNTHTTDASAGLPMGQGAARSVEPRCMALRKHPGSPIERAFVREERARSSDEVRDGSTNPDSSTAFKRLPPSAAACQPDEPREPSSISSALRRVVHEHSASAPISNLSISAADSAEARRDGRGIVLVTNDLWQKERRNLPFGGVADSKRVK
ncbi:hypothetical protein HETIRDRAFT_458231 [Heterobasidion irregulare TC 32-1]|uniref:Uncharacterized protein n=1 Tax=Heterobasidion irregulare (strain TC 32-1) TaxID=747525 RepID=W4KGR8_HETIT|nr:uncharacterized protein HETIRDRAFT_458231 [Heterobasidion irregulare TC 32-1]ETW84510.1 hypothetical protein HETIRDRAFT_458231 [Heterobasidion irregulare TC 32-1]